MRSNTWSPLRQERGVVKATVGLTPRTGQTWTGDNVDFLCFLFCFLFLHLGELLLPLPDWPSPTDMGLSFQAQDPSKTAPDRAAAKPLGSGSSWFQLPQPSPSQSPELNTCKQRIKASGRRGRLFEYFPYKAADWDWWEEGMNRQDSWGSSRILHVQWWCTRVTTRVHIRPQNGQHQE